MSNQPSTISQHYFICTPGRSELNSSSSCMLLQILCLNSQDTAALVYSYSWVSKSIRILYFFCYSLRQLNVSQDLFLSLIYYLLLFAIVFFFFSLSSGCIVFYLLSIQKIMHFFFNLQNFKD